MSLTIMSNESASNSYDALREVVRCEGHNYIDRLGWAVFLQQRGSDGVIRSLRMCDVCRSTPHNRETCPHPSCHGFYAATTDHDTFDRLWYERPEGNVLAVRTGQASGIFVVDFDLKHNAPAAHDAWGEVTGLSWTFPKTLRQATKSGGFHLVYRLPTANTTIKSRNAVTLRGIDVKGEGGLFVVDPTQGYKWHERVLPEAPGADVTLWASTAMIHRSSHATVRTSKLVERARRPLTARLCPDGETVARMSMMSSVPAGERDAYVNMVVWLLRTHGHEWDDAVEILRDEWNHMEHPAGDEFRWEWCLYKLKRVWRDIQLSPVVTQGVAWVKTGNSRRIVPHPGRRT